MSIFILIDEFAMVALNAILINMKEGSISYQSRDNTQSICATAYLYADEMLKMKKL